MNRPYPVIATFAAIALLPLVLAAAIETESPLDARVRAFTAAESWNNRWSAGRTLFGTASDAELTDLIRHDAAEVAIAAAWEGTMRAARKSYATHPPADDSDLGILRHGDRGWFLGFLEGRLRRRVPSSWSEVWRTFEFYSAPESSSASIEFGRCEPFVAVFANWYLPRGQRLVRAPRESGAVVEIELGDRQYSLPASLFPAADEPTCVNLLPTSDALYLAVTPLTGGPFEVYRLDPKDSRVVWKSSGWGEGEAGGHIHVWNHWTGLETSKQDLYVFGVSNTLYVEAFDLATGKRTLHFLAN